MKKEQEVKSGNYQRTNWTESTPITATALNNIETGIADSAKTGNDVVFSTITANGNILFPDNTNIKWSRNTDEALIGFENDSDNDTDSYMYFRTGDNGNEFFRWQIRNAYETTNYMTLKPHWLYVNGNIETTKSNGNFIAPNNYGYMGRKTDGAADYMLYMDTNNRVHVGHNNRLIMLDCDNPVQRSGYKLYHQGYKPNLNDVVSTGSETNTNIRANEGVTLPVGKSISWSVPGDYCYIRGSQSDGRSYLDLITGDDENDAVRIITKHWSSGERVIMQSDYVQTWFQCHVKPWSHNRYSLGSDSVRWKDIYASDHVIGQRAVMQSNSHQFVAKPTSNGQVVQLRFEDQSGNYKGYIGMPNSNWNTHVVSTSGLVILRGGYTNVRNHEDTAYAEIRASRFSVNSEKKWKSNVVELENSALDMINATTIFEYDKSEGEKTSHEIGIIISENTPPEILSEGEYRDDRPFDEQDKVKIPLDEQVGDKFINIYSMGSVAWKGIQELATMVNELKDENWKQSNYIKEISQRLIVVEERLNSLTK